MSDGLEYTCDYCKTKFNSLSCSSWQVCPHCLDIECNRNYSKLSLSAAIRNVLGNLNNTLVTARDDRTLRQGKAEMLLLVAEAMIELERWLKEEMRGENDSKRTKYN